MKEKDLKKLYRYSETERAFYLDIQLEDYRDVRVERIIVKFDPNK